MSSSYTVRRYEPGDAEDVERLHEQRSWDVEHAEPEHEVYDDIEDIEGAYLDAGGEFLVGIEDDDLVATGGYEPVGDDVVVLKRLRVDPGHQRKGYGAGLLSELESRAREDGYEAMIIDETGMNTTAQAFLEDRGYQVTGTSIHLGTELLSYRKRLV
jgi:GNAT superfamily N-acetyltransferase